MTTLVLFARLLSSALLCLTTNNINSKRKKKKLKSSNSQRNELRVRKQRCKMEAKAQKMHMVGLVGDSNFLLVHDKKDMTFTPHSKQKPFRDPMHIYQGQLLFFFSWGWKGTSTFVNFAKSRNAIWEHPSVDTTLFCPHFFSPFSVRCSVFIVRYQLIRICASLNEKVFLIRFFSIPKLKPETFG